MTIYYVDDSNCVQTQTYDYVFNLEQLNRELDEEYGMWSEDMEEIFVEQYERWLQECRVTMGKQRFLDLLAIEEPKQEVKLKLLALLSYPTFKNRLHIECMSKERLLAEIARVLNQ